MSFEIYHHVIFIRVPAANQCNMHLGEALIEE